MLGGKTGHQLLHQQFKQKPKCILH